MLSGNGVSIPLFFSLVKAYLGKKISYGFVFVCTVTFSRMDPEGKLIMGFRKASNSVAMQV